VPAADDNGDAAGTPAPDGTGIAVPDLALADILPYTPSIGTPPRPAAPRPAGPLPSGEAVADYGHTPLNPWPLIAGLIVSLAVLVFGGGFVWWRNRDSRYWPA
jgi:hypothetical protein